MQRVDAAGDLEHERDLAFQQREWALQRGAWVAMTGILLAALAGLLGSGPVSDAAAEEGPLAVAYHRFERRHAPTELEIRIAPGAAAGDQLEVWLPVAYVDAVEIESIVPEPASVRAGGDRVVYAFARTDPAHPLAVRFSLEHDHVGFAPGGVGLVGGPEIAFRQVVYP